VVCGLLALTTSCTRSDNSYRATGTAGTIPVFTGPSSIGDSVATIVGGAYLGAPRISVNGVAPTGPGDIEVTTVNGVALTSASGGSAISVVETLGAAAVNLSTVGGGTTDWYTPDPGAPRESCSSPNGSKVSGHKGIACQGGVYAILTPGAESQSAGNDPACSICLTWNAGDGGNLYAPPALTTTNYVVFNYSPNPTGDYGVQMVIPALTTQQVARTYMVMANVVGSLCTATLTDGSGVTASTSPVTGASVQRTDTWTFHARKSNEFLVVYCHVVATSGGSSAVAFLGVALGST
jgi:hypothetical protein